MTQNEEESLVQWILSLDQCGAAPQHAHIQEMANILLSKKSRSTTRTVGDKWVYNFVKHHDSLKSWFSWHYSYQYVKCEDPKTIREWFDSLQVTIIQHGIAPEDIYNFDEIGYAMGLVATAKVVTRAESWDDWLALSSTARELWMGQWIISNECINVTGWVLSPALSLKWRSILRDGIKMRCYQRIGGLELVQIDGYLIRSGSNGLKISLFQLLIVAV